MKKKSLLLLGVCYFSAYCDQDDSRQGTTRPVLTQKAAVEPDDTPTPPVTEDPVDDDVNNLEDVQDVLKDTPDLVDQDQLNDTKDLKDQIIEPVVDEPSQDGVDSGLIKIVTALILLDSL